MAAVVSNFIPNVHVLQFEDTFRYFECSPALRPQINFNPYNRLLMLFRYCSNKDEHQHPTAQSYLRRFLDCVIQHLDIKVSQTIFIDDILPFYSYPTLLSQMFMVLALGERLRILRLQMFHYFANQPDLLTNPAKLRILAVAITQIDEYKYGLPSGIDQYGQYGLPSDIDHRLQTFGRAIDPQGMQSAYLHYVHYLE